MATTCFRRMSLHWSLSNNYYAFSVFFVTVIIFLGYCVGSKFLESVHIPRTCSLLARLDKARFDLNVTQVNIGLQSFVSLHAIAALPGGGAAIQEYHGTLDVDIESVWRINHLGMVTDLLYQTVEPESVIQGIIVVKQNLYILHLNGTIVKIPLSSSDLLHPSFHVLDVTYLTHQTSISADTDDIHRPDSDLKDDTEPDSSQDNLLVFADSGMHRHEVFTFNLYTNEKIVKVRKGLMRPYSVSYINEEKIYVVCDHDNHTINIYNSTWHLVTQMGGFGTGGQLFFPSGAIPITEGTIVVADTTNNRLSEFDTKGNFLGHIFNVSQPYHLSFRHPHIWVSSEGRFMYRIQLYQE